MKRFLFLIIAAAALLLFPVNVYADNSGDFTQTDEYKEITDEKFLKIIIFLPKMLKEYLIFPYQTF